MTERTQPDGDVPAGYHVRRLPGVDVQLDRAALSRALGFSPPPSAPSDTRSPTVAAERAMPPHLIEVVNNALESAPAMIDPHWVWTERRVTIRGDALYLADGHGPLEVGSIVRNQLRGSESVAAFVVTIGARLEDHARVLMLDPERSLEGYVLDTIASMAVEAVGDRLEAEVLAAAEGRGWGITNRYSPGYCTWETSGQQSLFALFPDRPAGIVLGESSLMLPIKSISGVIGLGPDVVHRAYVCEFCAMTDCRQRSVE